MKVATVWEDGGHGLEVFAGLAYWDKIQSARF